MSKKILLISLVALLSCTSLLSKQLLKLQDRTLLIDPKGRGLIYPYNEYVCLHPNRWINKKCKWKRREIIYNLNDEKTRDMLIHAGFQCSSKNQFNY